MNSIIAQERIIALRKKRSAQDLRFKYYGFIAMCLACLLYTSPSPRDRPLSRMPSSA